jgi:hypothetical protein
VVDPRALLDAYEYDNAANDDHAPQAFVALRAVLDLHKPEPDIFAVGQDGSCVGCHLGDPLKLTNYNVGGLRLKFHDHPYQGDTPVCDHCRAEEDNLGEPIPLPVPWPCPTLQAVITALEADRD